MQQYDFETVKLGLGSGPERLLSARRQAKHEAHRQWEIDIKKRTAIRLRTVIADLGQEIANLDISIASELALARVRDRAHFAYPISVRMMQARRENLEASVAALSDRLSLIDLPREDSRRLTHVKALESMWHGDTGGVT
jgi:hypothetical protein